MRSSSDPSRKVSMWSTGATGCCSPATGAKASGSCARSVRAGSARALRDDVDVDVRGASDQLGHERAAQDLLPAGPARLSDHQLRDELRVGDVQHPGDRILVVDHQQLTAEVGDQLFELDQPRGGVGLVTLARVNHEEVTAGPLRDPGAAPYKVVGGLWLTDADQDPLSR